MERAIAASAAAPAHRSSSRSIAQPQPPLTGGAVGDAVALAEGRGAALALTCGATGGGALALPCGCGATALAEALAEGLGPGGERSSHKGSD